MSSISNRFYITALEDGTTLHGNLAVEGSLSQAWNGTGCIPDWKDPDEQPLIYLTLLSGGTLVQPANDFKWLYNGVEITFDASTGKSLTPVANVFQKTTKSVTYGTQQAVVMPALKIIDNLAGSDNADVDLITFEGSYVVGGSGLSFTATAQVRISKLSEGSTLGVINFHNGISDITEETQTIIAFGKLYNPDGSAANATTKWYVNDVYKADGTTIEGHQQAVSVTQQDVVDHAILRCDFYVGAEKKYSAYASVDDMQDPQFMYIQYNGNNGNAASMRKEDNDATFKIWVGTRTDTTPDTSFNVIKVKLLDGDGEVITASGLATNIPDPAADGYRTLPIVGGKATITVAYNTVAQVGKKNLTGIILAETSVPQS